jgi:hypothetical protein
MLGHAMPLQRPFEPAQAFLSLLVVVLVLAVHLVMATRALNDLWRADRRVRGYSKQVWAILITVVGIIGPAAYFWIGRDDAW